MQSNSVIEIQRTPLFRGISSAIDLQCLATNSVLKSVSPNEVILHEGAEAAEIWIIVRGEVRICFNDQNIESLRLHEGSLFGEMEYFEPSAALATVVAVTDCELIAIPHAVLRDLTNSNPRLLIELNRGFLKTLTEKHRLVTDSLVEWKRKSGDAEAHSADHRPAFDTKSKDTSSERRAETEVGSPLAMAIGDSEPMHRLRELVAKIKDHRGNVLILGEPGVGKELVANALAPRKVGQGIPPFVAVDSATLSSSTVESLLFGHEKGAFTGAESRHVGIFERANGGIIYFDEIGNMPLDVQAKLLRAIQEKTILRVGGTTPIQLAFRVVAATNKNLEEACRSGEFRFDLYSRLSVFELTVPPLRERRDDISLLVDFFLSARQVKKSSGLITQEARDRLLAYDWPGNVRELKNVLDYSIAMADGDTITCDCLPDKIIATELNANANTLRQTVEQTEKMVLLEQYRRANGNISELARTLKADRSGLYRKLRHYNIHEG